MRKDIYIERIEKILSTIINTLSLTWDIILSIAEWVVTMIWRLFYMILVFMWKTIVAVLGNFYGRLVVGLGGLLYFYFISNFFPYIK